MYPRIDPGYASHYPNQNAPVRKQCPHWFDSGEGSHSNYAAPKQGDEPGLQLKCLAVQKQGQWQGRRQGQGRGPGQEQPQRQGGGAGAMALLAKNSVTSLGKRCLKSLTKSWPS